MGGISMNSIPEKHASLMWCVVVLAVAAWCSCFLSTRLLLPFGVVVGVGMRVWVWCGLYGLACCWVLRQQAPLFEGFGVSVFVLCLCAVIVVVHPLVGWVAGGWCGGVGLLFGNCIVNASIL